MTAALKIVPEAKGRRAFGSINQQANGKWRIRYRSGGRLVSGGTFATEKAAKAAKAALTVLEAKSI